MANSIIGTLIYKITGDSTALEQSLEKSQSRISKTADSITKLGQRANRVATAVFSGVFIKSILEASSRVEELDSKFNTVFSGIEATADAWAREYAEATNRGVTSTKEFLATQQDLRTGYGDSAEAAMKYAQAVVGVTNDLASFSNVPVEEAMQAVNSGLSGQFEALRRLGVGLNTNIVNQGEYAKSINKTWDEMNNLEKQEAVLSGIMNQSKNAIHQNVQVWTDYDYRLGDAALTSESFANSAQGLTQRLDDLKAELGDTLLPMATNIIAVASGAVKAFNSWDDAAQSLTVALLAFGAAMTAIGGPAGAVVGALGALLVVFGNNRDAVDELRTSTDRLKAASANYGEYTKKLSSNVETLTENERLLLEIRQEQAKLDARNALANAKTAYEDARKALSKHSEELEINKGAFEAYSYAYQNGLAAVEEKLDEYDRKSGKLTLQERGNYDALSEVYAKYWHQKEEVFTAQTKKMAATQLEKLTKLQSYETKYEASRASLISSIASALNAGIVNTQTLELLYPDLIEEVQKCAQALDEETDAIDSQERSINKAITATEQWRDARAEQLADILEEQNDYKAAAELRIGLIEKERKANLEALALSSGVIQEGQRLTEEVLNEAMASSEEFALEYEALMAYYTALVEEELSKETDHIEKELEKQKQADEDLAKTRETNAKAYTEKLLRQSIAYTQSIASELESQGKIEEAYKAKLSLIDDEEARELEALDVLIAANQATEEDRLNLKKYYAGERALLQKEETTAYKAQLEEQKKAEEELAKTRASNAESWNKKLREQDISTREGIASTYEAEGDLQSAYEIRLQLLDEELKREEEALQRKVAANEATEAEMEALRLYYRNKRDALSQEENEAIAESLEKQKAAEEELARTRASNADAWVRKLREQDISTRESTASALESEDKIEEAYRIRYELLDEELKIEKEALQAKIDTNEASAEDLISIERYYQNEKAKLQDEEAKAYQAILDKQKEEEKDLAKAREANAKAYMDKLREQKDANDENTASELESQGRIREAYEIRERLLLEERDRELEALQVLIDAKEATEEDKTRLQEYYENERKALKEEETQAELDLVEKNLQEQKDTWKSFVSDLKSLTSDLGSALVDLYGAMTDNAISEIENQTQARLEALGLAERTEKEKLQEEYEAAVEAGDMALAQEKQKALQRLQIEEASDKQKAKLQREQAERERNLRIYTTTLDMLSAVVKYLADPGGWAGAALSAMAATTGALQIAAIKAEALPSFDVGANYIPEDMLALVHQGETILPEPMAESVRRGDAVLGKAQTIQVTIINNTSAEVTAKEIGTEEEREVRITIGQVVQSQIETGRFDSAMGRRYGLRRVGRNV